jgi:hypothetical protein
MKNINFRNDLYLKTLPIKYYNVSSEDYYKIRELGNTTGRLLEQLRRPIEHLCAIERHSYKIISEQ